MDNRRLIHASNTEPGNIKRLMLRNFSELIQKVQACKDKQQLLQQYCDVFNESETQQHRKSFIDASKSKEYQKLE